MRLSQHVKERPQLALATLLYCVVAMVFLTLVLSGKETIVDHASSLIITGLWLIVMARSQK